MRELMVALEEIIPSVNPPPGKREKDERAPKGRLCDHEVCKRIESLNLSKSMGVAFLSERECKVPVRDPSPTKRIRENTEPRLVESCILLARHLTGQCRGTFSVPSGKMDPVDDGCWIATARRELHEELKLKISEQEFFEFFCDRDRTHIRLLQNGRTPIFVGFYPEINIRVLNNQLELAAQDPSTPAHEREVDRVEWFRIASKTTPEGTRHPMSGYAKQVMDLISRSSALS